MTSKAIIALVIALGGSPNEARIIDAFAMQESSRAAKGIHAPGDNGEAWGIWQFHKARYKELGGRNYGKASANEQARVMLKAFRKYTRKSRWGKLSAEQQVIVAGRYHNMGHCKLSQRSKHYSYTRSVWKYYLTIVQKSRRVKA